MNALTKNEAKTDNPQPDPDQRLFANPERTSEADERLRVLNETIEAYQADHPFIEAATVFGSTVHGEARPESDIDAFVFVDPASLPEEFSTEVNGRRVLTARDAKDMGRAMQVDLMAGLGKTVTRDGEHEKNDVKVFAINEAAIEEELAKQIKQYEAFARYRQARDILIDRYHGQNPLPEQDFDEYATQALGEPPYPDSIDWSIPALFHPGVGDTERLQTLRSAVVNSLPESAGGAKAWEEIKDRVAMFEGDLHHRDDLSVALPDTVADARQAFGS